MSARRLAEGDGKNEKILSRTLSNNLLKGTSHGRATYLLYRRTYRRWHRCPQGDVYCDLSMPATDCEDGDCPRLSRTSGREFIAVVSRGQALFGLRGGVFRLRVTSRPHHGRDHQ